MFIKNLEHIEKITEANQFQGGSMMSLPFPGASLFFNTDSISSGKLFSTGVFDVDTATISGSSGSTTAFSFSGYSIAL